MAAPPPLHLEDTMVGPEPGTPLATLEDLRKNGAKDITFRSGDHQVRIFLIVHGDEILAYENRCPHAGTPLNLYGPDFFNQSGKLLLCRTHGALFEPRDGLCRRGPCKGQYLRRIAIDIDGNSIVSA